MLTKKVIKIWIIVWRSYYGLFILKTSKVISPKHTARAIHLPSSDSYQCTDWSEDNIYVFLDYNKQLAQDVTLSLPREHGLYSSF